MIRKLVSLLNESLSEKLVSARRRHNAQVKIWFAPDLHSGKIETTDAKPCLVGETVDISRTGIAFLVPSIRIKDKYLVGQDRNLIMELDLPRGKVQLRVIGRRYEKFGPHLSTERFLVGAHILGFETDSEGLFMDFLKNRRRGHRTTGELQLGLD
jgi:hypothetical protein